MKNYRGAFTVVELILSLTAATVLMFAMNSIWRAVGAAHTEKMVRLDGVAYHVVPSTQGGAEARLVQAIIHDMLTISTERYVFMGANQATRTAASPNNSLDTTWPKPLSQTGINSFAQALQKLPSHRRANVRAIAALLDDTDNYVSEPHTDDFTMVFVLGESVLGYAQQTCIFHNEAWYYTVSVTVSRPNIIPGVIEGGTSFLYRACFTVTAARGAIPPGVAAWQREPDAVVAAGWGMGDVTYYTVIFADPMTKAHTEVGVNDSKVSYAERGVSFSRFTYGANGFR
jgi:hypothetical protein